MSRIVRCFHRVFLGGLTRPSLEIRYVIEIIMLNSDGDRIPDMFGSILMISDYSITKITLLHFLPELQTSNLNSKFRQCQKFSRKAEHEENHRKSTIDDR